MKRKNLKRRVQMLERQMMRTFDYDVDHTDRIDAMGVDFRRIDATLMELREKVSALQAQIAAIQPTGVPFVYVPWVAPTIEPTPWKITWTSTGNPPEGAK